MRMEVRKAIESFLQKQSYPEFRPRAVFFDMDGVLYDSMPAHAKAWVEALKAEGVSFSEYQAYLNEGRTGHGTIDDVFAKQKGREATEEEKQRIYKHKSEIFDRQGEAEKIDGIEDVMDFVRRAGWLAYLVTGSGQPSLLERLEHSFPGMFVQERMVTAFDVKHGKPNPEPYLMGLQKAGVKANEAIVVENAPLGVQAGVAAGIFTIAVNTGPLTDEVLLKKGANLLFHSMMDLYNDWNVFYQTLQ